ncbi:MAG: helix-turn-helix domain-containing protein [Clostridia bacterium]|nr:helix-turn-helix domain-containing protein [Clostridia bacterium]
MRNYSPIRFKDTIKINQFYTVEYYESANSFDLGLDLHNFWELSYVDQGKFECMVNDETVELKQNEVLLIPPNTLHQYKHLETDSATVLFICFSSRSAVLESIIGKHSTTKELREILSKMIAEIRATFTFTFNTDIRMIDVPEIGGEQLTKNHLIELLIKLARKKRGTSEAEAIPYANESDNQLVNKILTHLKNHVYDRLTLDDLSARLFYTKAYLNRIFKQHIHSSIKEYYSFLKIQESKKLLLEAPNTTVTEIATALKFDTPSYFIKAFRKHVGVTPGEFRQTILKT